MISVWMSDHEKIAIVRIIFTEKIFAGKIID